MRGHVCGGTPSEHDLEVIRDFAAALAKPTKDEQRAALLEMSDDQREPPCPVCGAHDRQPCNTASGRDHKARALGWPTTRRPKEPAQ